MLTTIASIIAGAIGVAIIFIGGRFLIAPRTAATGYGLPLDPDLQTRSSSPYPWLYVKGLRDIASGIFIFILLADRSHLLGPFMAAAALIPAGDAVIVLRNGGTRAAAFGIHGATAAIMLAASAALLLA
ncbi:MAG: DUF4267 domain-containing protein [Tardiphaga sp.]